MSETATICGEISYLFRKTSMEMESAMDAPSRQYHVAKLEMYVWEERSLRGDLRTIEHEGWRVDWGL
jgi:hypothetical protein